jgi:diguanylate cyclase
VLPERARPLLDRLVARVADEPARREELVSAFMQAPLGPGGPGSGPQCAVGQRAVAGLGLDARAAAARAAARGSKQWTAARKKDSLQRVLDGSRSDMQRLQQRLGALVGAWESDAPLPPEDGEAERPPRTPPAKRPPRSGPAGACNAVDGLQDWPAVVTPLRVTINAGLPEGEPRAIELADRLAALADRLAAEGPTPRACSSWTAPAAEIRRLFAHRHHLVDQLGRLCTELGQGLAELAEDDSWARGQASRCMRGWPRA